jgi:hypothetical protein
VHSDNGFGSSSLVPGLNAPASAGLAAASGGNGSSAPVLAILLAAIVLIIGVFLGVRAPGASLAEPPSNSS